MSRPPALVTARDPGYPSASSGPVSPTIVPASPTVIFPVAASSAITRMLATASRSRPSTPPGATGMLSPRPAAGVGPTSPAVRRMVPTRGTPTGLSPSVTQAQAMWAAFGGATLTPKTSQSVFASTSPLLPASGPGQWASSTLRPPQGSNGSPHRPNSGGVSFRGTSHQPDSEADISPSRAASCEDADCSRWREVAVRLRAAVRERGDFELERGLEELVAQFCLENDTLRRQVEKLRDPVHTCVQCNKVYKQSENEEGCCSFHPGHLRFYSCTGCGGQKYFNCCNKCENCSPGCRHSRHATHD